MKIQYYDKTEFKPDARFHDIICKLLHNVADELGIPEDTVVKINYRGMLNGGQGTALAQIQSVPFSDGSWYVQASSMTPVIPLLNALTHELVHLSQMVSGRLVTINPTGATGEQIAAYRDGEDIPGAWTVFDGKKVDMEAVNGQMQAMRENGEDWRRALPFEAEAYDRQSSLLLGAFDKLPQDMRLDLFKSINDPGLEMEPTEEGKQVIAVLLAERIAKDPVGGLGILAGLLKSGMTGIGGPDAA